MKNEETGLGQKHNFNTNFPTPEAEQALDLLMKSWDEIGDKLNLETTWSVTEIENLHGFIGIQPLYLTDGIHNEVKIELPNIPLTWVHLWEASELLYKKIGDIEHKFIEQFELKEKNNTQYLEVFFGS